MSENKKVHWQVVEAVGTAGGTAAGTYFGGQVGGTIGGYLGSFLDDILIGIGDILSDIGDFLFGKSLVEEVQEDLIKQAKIMADEVAMSIQQMGQEVEGGSWQGDGATKYLEESSLLLNDTTKLIEALTKTEGSITAVMDVLTAVDDNTATTFMDALDELVGFVVA